MVTVNGAPREGLEGSSLAALVEAEGCKQEQVASALNGTLVRREERARRLLRQGDTVEIFRFMGGG
ncbi:MAG: sulfur carrier protein ThiS [Treponema sp.]|jgi:thiamine biosynthesis protein ThiS|nr:sulfur carrier protein ThiS [Treponema sp.]